MLNSGTWFALKNEMPNRDPYIFAQIGIFDSGSSLRKQINLVKWCVAMRFFSSFREISARLRGLELV